CCGVTHEHPPSPELPWRGRNGPGRLAGVDAGGGGAARRDAGRSPRRRTGGAGGAGQRRFGGPPRSAAGEAGVAGGSVVSGFKGTPGPWSTPHFAEPDLDCQCGFVLTERHFGAVATVHCSGDGDDIFAHGDNPKFEQAVANARLISAAPELLEVCQKFSALFGALWDTVDPEGGGFLSPESVEKYDAVHAEMSAAIAKATGGDA